MLVVAVLDEPAAPLLDVFVLEELADDDVSVFLVELALLESKTASAGCVPELLLASQLAAHLR